MEYFLCFLFLHDSERVGVVLCLGESLPLCQPLEIVVEDSHHVDSSKEQYVSKSLEKREGGWRKGKDEEDEGGWRVIVCDSGANCNCIAKPTRYYGH